MSRQHFYSRVPSRVSMYNKTDGFDTFAKSEGLDRETVLGELSVAYADKLNIHDPITVRRGEIPTVYSQLALSTGETVHTAITYLPTDFTGERSAYLAHSLILDEAEQSAIFGGDNNDVFNPDMFVSDILPFNITSPTASANPAFPDTAYIPHALTDPSALVCKYNPEMMKNLIFAVINSLLGGGEVAFRLPIEDRYASREALGIINAILSVLPSEMRRRLSFVSFASRYDAYPGVKLKYLGSKGEAPNPGKCAFYDFSTGVVTGQPAGYENNLSIAAFFYSLMQNGRVREKFLSFASGIREKYGREITDVRTLAEMVFVFWQCSGLYVERSILPTDESIVNFLDIYAKYREGIVTEYRVQAYRPLARYANEQVAIPAPIFDRLCNLYPTECVQAKAVALDVLLHIIHVDVMRDKLFAFINKNYAGEIAAVKSVINSNLARVFYGGFLQHRILSFFDMNWRGEPVATRDFILDRLLLSIRTPTIQRNIVAFLEKHYDTMNSAQKMKICNTCLEMMPECDQLSALLAGLINKRIGRDGGDISLLMSEKLTAQLNASLCAGDPRLASIFMENSGFLEDLAEKHILGQRVGGEIFINILAAMPAHKRALKLVNIYKTLPGLTEETYGYLLRAFTEIPVNVHPSTMYEIIGAEESASKVLSSEAFKLFCSCIIYPVIRHTFYDVFRVKYGKEGIDTLLKYAEGKKEIMSSEQYLTVIDYVKMTEYCRAGDTESVFKLAEKMPESPAIRQGISEHIRMCALDTASQSVLTTCTFELLINYLRTGSFRFDAVYTRYRRHYERIRQKEINFITEKLDPADRRGAADAAELLMACVLDICNASDALARIVCDNASGLRRALEEFFGIYGVGARIFLNKHFEDGFEGVSEIIDDIVDKRNSSISSVDDALDLILRRK